MDQKIIIKLILVPNSARVSFHANFGTKSHHGRTSSNTLEFAYVVITREKSSTKIGFFNGIHVRQDNTSALCVSDSGVTTKRR